jgi:hypothetical protein
MTVAIIGWGSLIWCPGALHIQAPWHFDGPSLRVEYSRISKSERLTLVIHQGCRLQQTLWTPAVSDEIDVVRRNLREREGTYSRFIHSATAEGDFSAGVGAEVRNAIAGWLNEHRELQACVWTGLSSNWREVKDTDFSVANAIRYLRDLPDPAAAREYIRNTPAQIQTEVRAAAREQLNWQDARLPAVLFAPQ